MKPVLLIDFGSTYTKVTAVDLSAPKLLGTAQSYTTIETDINNGLDNALKNLREKIGDVEFQERYACSSAAGGLKMISVGLVPELTAEAAKMASLGAGAKIMKVYSFHLTEEDAEEIASLRPDILLLVGGTDGGNSECILYNAEVISRIDLPFPVIVAGNRNASGDCKHLLEKTHPVFVCENVMPKFEVLNIEPAQKKIRDIFLERIVSAKGLTKATDLVSGIVNPTPAAVMRGIRLLAEGTDQNPGIGELLAVDVGGATTDVYSICDGRPTKANTVFKGLPEPYQKRTVEGDIGMRYSIHGILEAAGLGKISELSGIRPGKCEEMIDLLGSNTERVPRDETFENLDYALASMAIDTAVDRHAGKVSEVFTVMGMSFMQTGKDLSNIRKIIVTGGSLIHTKRTLEIASHALYSKDAPMSLRPMNAHVLLDKSYIISAMGLLSEHYEEEALQIMKQELIDLGEVQSTAVQAEHMATSFQPMDNQCHGF